MVRDTPTNQKLKVHLEPEVRKELEPTVSVRSSCRVDYRDINKQGSNTNGTAVNVHLRDVHDFGGNLNLMACWQWRGSETDRLLRFGLQYYNGKSSQYAFFDRHDDLIGFGLWMDY